MKRHWDIFCRVIDNFGDIGVCWRLARQLATEHDLAVRLWVDDPDSLAALAPECNPRLECQHTAGVEVRHWTENPDFDRVADVVIEGFACELPPNYLEAMALQQPAPCWINLEYLSAEPWIDDCHGMASPHPRLPLVKHFFFPGFSVKSGGLLREHGLPAIPPPFSEVIQDTLEISLFCYETAPVGALLDLLAVSPVAIRCLVPPGKPLAAVRHHLGDGGPWQRGLLKVEAIPFLHQDEYDRLLHRCAVNFVRGEDSFLRAQWAGKPFVWQIYEQEGNTHLIKLDAFMNRYLENFAAAPSQAVRAMFMAWNTGTGMETAWPAFLEQRRVIGENTGNWSRQLAKSPDLASALVNFCASRV